MSLNHKKDFELISFFLRYVMIAFLCTLIAFAVVGIVYIFVDIPKNILEILTLSISIVVALAVSFIAGRETGSVLTGGCVILIFALIRCLFAIIGGFVPLLSLRTPFEIASGFLIGLIGGIAGCGSSRRRR